MVYDPNKIGKPTRSGLFYRSPALSRDAFLQPAKVQDVSKIEDRARCVRMDYTNWRGERRMRLIKPIELEFTSNEWHKTRQWLLKAKDVEDGKVKSFALSGIHSWMPESYASITVKKKQD